MCLPQIATKAGTWNAPIWTEAGQVWANDHPEIPQGEFTRFCGLLASLAAMQQHVLSTCSAIRITAPMSNNAVTSNAPVRSVLLSAAAALFFVELLLMGWVETKRWQDFRNPGSQGTMSAAVPCAAIG